MGIRTRMIRKLSFFLFFISCLYLFCVQVEAKKTMKAEVKKQAISREAWGKVSQLKIFFGHQSVGNNIIDGLKMIADQNKFSELTIIETRNGKDITGPMLAHNKVGQNKQPVTKINDFREIIASGIGNKIDIALLKLCYVDINPETNTDALFRQYKKTFDQIQQEYPNVIFLHATCPLRTVQIGPKAWLKKFFGRQRAGVQDNMKRYAFNQKMRQEYAKKGLLFDIAEIESTLPDGSRSFFMVKGVSYEAMYSGYTHDGGHLNSFGKQSAALYMVRLLSNVAQR